MGRKHFWSTLILNFKVAIVSIGGKLSVGSSVNTVDALFERLIFKNSVATDDEINSILNYSLGVCKTNYFDSFDRLKKTSINFGMSSLTHAYSYQNNNGRTSNSIIQEILPNNRVYSYSYDGFGNVNSVTFAESITQTGTTTHYVYDTLNRLVKSYINPETPNIYSYDSNGNILSKNGVSYVYDPVYKDRLMSVGNDITFEYNFSSPLFPTKITKGNNVFNLVRNTNRLESVNDISFIYDHFKRRVKKIRGNDATKYFYNGETLEAIEISENNNTYKFIYYYDENGKLIGFTYNTSDYLFTRDISGNIKLIYGVDEGAYLVNYSYDDRGQPTITSNNNEIGNLLAQKNCIL
ncbi:MAG: hypothetical protein SOV26_01205, partial [Candidatus Onthovivens sp.]|nr:hypothetical protein [Candidatus Onthovivens sp.]